MAWVKNEWGGKLSIEPHKTDMSCFKVVKIRQPVTCCNCRKKIPSKSYAYGTYWTRLCLKCGEEFSDVGIKAFENIIEYIKLNQQRHQKNKNKWESENTIALL